jgi:hypothetical protein
MGLLNTSFEGVTLTRSVVRYKTQGGPIDGAIARVESGSDIRQRATATGDLAIGVFALAAEKRTGNIYLSVEGNGFEFVVELPARKESDARTFAAKINNAAAHTN